MISFTVYGKPQPAGSKKGHAFKGKDGATHVSVSDANPESKPWKLQVAQVAGYQMQGYDMLEGALSVVFRFVRPRPRGHFKVNGDLSAHGRRNPHPITRPDALKLARGVEDAMTGIVYHDDSAICKELLVKEWGEPARVEIEISQLDDSPIMEKSTQGALEF